jgi:hypothetical protein
MHEQHVRVNGRRVQKGINKNSPVAPALLQSVSSLFGLLWWHIELFYMEYFSLDDLHKFIYLLHDQSGHPSAVENINTWKSKGVRAPHKPLLMLLALGEI